MQNKRFPAWLPLFLCMSLVLFAYRELVAHAVLVEASPQADSTVSGPDVAIRLRFNVRIDAGRSRVAITAAPQGAAKTLKLDKQNTPDVLTTRAAGLSAGKYKLEWQVLAADGHITRGEVLFTVR